MTMNDNLPRTVIWLDDLRDPKDYIDCESDNVLWIKDGEEFMRHLTEYGLPDLIDFDHDLGEGSPDGYECAKKVVEYCLEHGKKRPQWRIHSANPVGRNNMESIFSSYEKWLEALMDSKS